MEKPPSSLFSFMACQGYNTKTNCICKFKAEPQSFYCGLHNKTTEAQTINGQYANCMRYYCLKNNWHRSNVEKFRSIHSEACDRAWTWCHIEGSMERDFEAAASEKAATVANEFCHNKKRRRSYCLDNCFAEFDQFCEQKKSRIEIL